MRYDFTSRCDGTLRDYIRKQLIVFAAMLSTLMIQGMVLMIPQYQILNGLHLINTYGAIIIPTLTNAGMIFLLTQFFKGIPRELDEAANIDGASIFTVYWRVVLPLAKPALITIPMLLIFIFFSRFYVQGVSYSGIK